MRHNKRYPHSDVEDIPYHEVKQPPYSRHSPTFSQMYWKIVWVLMIILTVMIIIAFTGCVNDNHRRLFVQVESGIIINVHQPRFQTADTVLLRHAYSPNRKTEGWTIVGNYNGTLPEANNKPDEVYVEYMPGIIIDPHSKPTSR